MTLVMVFTVSCSKGSGDDKGEKKDSTAKVDVKALANNPSDDQVIAALNQLVSNVKSLGEKEDPALFSETVALYAALEPIMRNASGDLMKKAQSILAPLNDPKYNKIEEQIKAALKNGNAPASPSYDSEDPEAPEMDPMGAGYDEAMQMGADAAEQGMQMAADAAEEAGF